VCDNNIENYLLSTAIILEVRFNFSFVSSMKTISYHDHSSRRKIVYFYGFAVVIAPCAADPTSVANFASAPDV
jgi:hypothetical protein